MIAVSSSGRSFRALAAYLATGRTGEEHDRVAWSIGRNLPTDDPELAATFMRATAALSDRVERPVYHIALSFDPSDPVDRATMEQVADHLLARLGLAEHQAVIVAHRDREHAHVHLLINRVHPETGIAWERWRDQPLIQQILREEERALGLRQVSSSLAAPDREPTESPAQRAGADSDRGRLAETAPAPAEAGQREGRPPGLSRAEAVAADLRVYERAVALEQDQYTAQIEATAARARLTQLEAAVERARTATEQFDRALMRVYRDPDTAHRAYVAMAEVDGVTAATRAIAEHPSRFGALRSEEHARALGLLHRSDDGRARNVAPEAASRGREMMEALSTLRECVAAARTAREASVPGMRPRPGDAQLSGGAAAGPARRWIQNLAAVRSAPEAQRTDGELHTIRAYTERLTAREGAIRAELQSLARRADLERGIAQVAVQLSPRELRHLHTILTAPQWAVAMKLRKVARDVVLGRSDTPER